MRLCIIILQPRIPHLALFCFNWDSLSLSLSLTLSVPNDAHSREWKWVQTVRSFVRSSIVRAVAFSRGTSEEGR